MKTATVRQLDQMKLHCPTQHCRILCNTYVSSGAPASIDRKYFQNRHGRAYALSQP